MNFKQQSEEKRKKEIAREIIEDFKNRQEERRPYELAWLLNINFLIGNQYSYISSRGEVDEKERMFPWESREVFNHIAPLVESRLSKLARVKPKMSVRPSGNEKSDIELSKLSRSILNSVACEKNLSELIAEATTLSEVTGTSFYKVVWDKSLGESFDIDNEKYDEICKNLINNGEKCKNNTNNADKTKKINLGDVSIKVVSPFEIFPDSCACESIEDCESIIHAYPISALEAEEIYGEPFVGSDINMMSFDSLGGGLFVSGISNVTRTTTTLKHNQVMVYEKYIKPNASFKNGKLFIVVGDKLVYEGDLPLKMYPFIRQVSSDVIGSFWGSSIIERCIPIQRAFNNIKNRKYEFFARLSAGVLAVEDGSVDIDNLEEEGLAPGKILVYRSGASVPRFMDAGSVPSELSYEEEKLKNEFISLTGVSELMRNSSLPNDVTSGTAINLLIEQDDTRLLVPAENIRKAIVKLGKLVLLLYKEFASYPKISRIIDENGDVELIYWKGSDISSCDVVLETTNELSETQSARKNMVLELLKNGLLYDENGKLSKRMKSKVFDALGFGNWESAEDITSLHIKKATRENLGLSSLVVSEIDDHDIHIEEHTKFLLSDEAENLSQDQIDKYIQHIREHKMFRSQRASGTK